MASLDLLEVVLFRPKYPENIGSTARAMRNMGARSLVLVAPQNFDLERAAPLATAHARSVLESARIVETLPEALSGCSLAVGTTARTGGWRKALLSPEKCAEALVERLAAGERAALVFGPEDRGLTNAETILCDRLATIPTDPDCASLNLSQAALLMLYECFRKAATQPSPVRELQQERDATFEERRALFANIQTALTDIDFLQADNTEYWMLPVRRFFSRFRLKRHEFNLLMGICRQVRRVAAHAAARGES